MPLQGFTAIFTVLRLLIPLKMSYGVAKKRAEPYSKIVEELPQIRREAVNNVFVSPLEPILEARTWLNVSVNRSLRCAFIWGE